MAEIQGNDSKLLAPTFAHRGCRVVSTADTYGHNLGFLHLGFLNWSHYYFFQAALPFFLRSSGSETGSTQPHKYN
jgi:hypothetical protein